MFHCGAIQFWPCSLFCGYRHHIMESSHHSHIGSVSFCSGDASMFHDPLVRSPLLPSVTAIIAETPGTVHQHLLRQNLLGARLKEKSKKTWSHTTQRLVTYPALRQSHSLKYSFNSVGTAQTENKLNLNKQIWGFRREGWDKGSCGKYKKHKKHK